MTDKRWQAIKEIFDAVVDLSPSEREKYLNEHCSEDPGLRQEIVELVAEESQVHSLLDGVALDAAGVLDDLTKESQQIGAYRLVEKLGVGGMGEVYLAERVDGHFTHQVALKLVRAGVQSEHIQQRFLMERQILARLNHPNIASLLDGGMTKDGQAYFVMEYVDGEPITKFANSRGLGVDSRLELFNQVCKAVTYAHQNLVVHRDLKPSNIIVTAEGHVKLLDFGIAKVLEHDDLDGTAPLTRTGAAVMTPAYASPEQMRGEPINTSSDIYSLGVVLYELLTGVRPYDVNPKNALDAARVINEVEPDRPSSRISSGAIDSPDSTTGTHGTEPGKLRRLLSGDLDVICLKALRKDPERRYATADELGDDVRRHRTGLPIQARADSVGYRTRKFARRHRIGIGISSIAILAILGTIFTYTSQLADARDEAVAARDESEGVTAFLTQVLQAAQPENQGPNVLMVDALEIAAEDAMTSNADNPILQARIQHELGYTFELTGKYDEAKRLLRAAIRTREQHLGMTHIDTRKSRDYLLRAIRSSGRREGQDSLMAVMVANLPDEPDEVSIATKFWQAIFVSQTGDNDRAIDMYQDIVDDYTEVSGPEATPTIQARKVRADALSRAGRRDEAMEEYQWVLDARERNDAPRSLILESKQAIAAEYRRMDKLEDAWSVYESLIIEMEDVLGSTSPTTLVTKSNAARALMSLDRPEEALPIVREVADAYESTSGVGHPRTVSARAYYAYVLGISDLSAARPIFEQVISESNTNWVGRPLLRATFRQYYAQRLGEHGAWDESIRWWKESMDVLLADPNSTDGVKSGTAVEIAKAYSAVGNEEEANSWRARAAEWSTDVD